MADELSIQAIEVNKPQQSQKSTTPYVLGGAALGGSGTGAAAQHSQSLEGCFVKYHEM